MFSRFLAECKWKKPIPCFKDEIRIMVGKLRENLEEGFVVKQGRYGIPSEEQIVPVNVAKAIKLIRQLGFLKTGEAYLAVIPNARKNSNGDNYSLCIGDGILLAKLSVYADQIINVEYDNDSLTVDELVKSLFALAKSTFAADDTRLTKNRLGRFCILAITNSNERYTNADIKTLALSEVKTETLITMMRQSMPLEAIMDMEELPDSWLQEIMSKLK